MDVVGYTDKLSAAPGERVAFMVSSRSPRYQAEFVRIRHGDTNPRGPGLKISRVSSAIDGTYEGVVQPIHTGSCAIVDGGAAFAELRSFTIAAWIWPTLPGARPQAISSLGVASTGFGLILGEGGRLHLRVGGKTPLETSAVLEERRWAFVWAGYDADSGICRLGSTPAREWPGTSTEMLEACTRSGSSVGCQAPLLFAAADILGGAARGGYAAFFNGKIENPSLYGRLLRPEEIAALRAGAAAWNLPGCLGAWDFAQEASGDRILDRSANQLHGRLLNMPARAMTGYAWTGRCDDFREVPGEYGAIHFHEDDMDDARWEKSFELTIPADLKSGVYAAHLIGDEGEDYVPLFVRPPRGTHRARTAFLVPTWSYLAYSNWQAFAHPLMRPEFERSCGEALAEIEARADNQFIMKQRLLSLYDSHSDGSGVCYAGRRRPHINIRPGYRWPMGRGGNPHEFVADTHILDWLEAQGHDYDVITDDDLNSEGAALLRPYKVVITGSHPEYHSEAMLDGLKAYLEGGGRLMYMGGNGFYWVTNTTSDGRAIEIRRAQGTRTWSAEPGEARLSTTGEPGGLWRGRGRAPQTLVGVGYTSYGVDAGVPYRRTEQSTDPRARFIFEGVEKDALIGDFPCLVMERGACGLELDRFDVALGSPRHALVVATASGFGDGYIMEVADLVAALPDVTGSRSPLVRADMVYLAYPNGGAVWTPGAIGWSGGLSRNRYDNPVSRITGNVLRAFLAD